MGSPLVSLSIGGAPFVVSRETLLGRPGTLLTAMFGGQMGIAPSRTLDEEGRYFIDRNPRHFPTILDFMRDGSAPVPRKRDERLALRAEACFFGCWPLVEDIDAAEARDTEAEANRTKKEANEALVTQVVGDLVREADREHAAGQAEEQAAREKLAEIEKQMAEVQREAEEAEVVLQRAMLRAAAAAEQDDRMRRLHAACLLWQVLSDEHKAACLEVRAALTKQQEARSRRLLAVHITDPRVPAKILSPKAPVSRIPLLPDRPADDFREWQQQRAAFGAGGIRGGAGRAAGNQGGLDPMDLLLLLRRRQNGNGQGARPGPGAAGEAGRQQPVAPAVVPPAPPAAAPVPRWELVVDQQGRAHLFGGVAQPGQLPGPPALAGAAGGVQLHIADAPWLRERHQIDLAAMLANYQAQEVAAAAAVPRQAQQGQRAGQGAQAAGPAPAAAGRAVPPVAAHAPGHAAGVAGAEQARGQVPAGLPGLVDGGAVPGLGHAAAPGLVEDLPPEIVADDVPVMPRQAGAAPAGAQAAAAPRVEAQAGDAGVHAAPVVPAAPEQEPAQPVPAARQGEGNAAEPAAVREELIRQQPPRAAARRQQEQEQQEPNQQGPGEGPGAQVAAAEKPAAQGRG